MKTCFVCGRTATRVDPDSGELMGAFHFGPSPARLPIRRVAVFDPWQRAAQIRDWAAGSAYERDKAMAQRLAEDLAPGWAWRDQHRG